MGAARRRRTDSNGIDDGYVDAAGVFHRIPLAVRTAVRTAMGLQPRRAVDEAAERAEQPPFPLVVAAADAAQLDSAEIASRSTHRAGDVRGGGGFEIAFEDGTTRSFDGHTLPPNLPLGYHELRPRRGEPRALIVGPGRCPLDPATAGFGFAVQVYALRSAASLGIGDLGDLARFHHWARSAGASTVLVSPHLATSPHRAPEPSPYSPSSRRFFEPLYLRVQDVPGAERAAAEVERAVAAGTAANADRRIDRAAAWDRKRAALEAIFRATGVAQSASGDTNGGGGGAAADGLAAWRRAQGHALEEFATFQALAERQRTPWRQWPAELRAPDAPGVAAFAAEHAERVTFHAWLQWLLDVQRARAAEPLRPMQDLPIGFDPDGADAWCWQQLLANGASIGAPPDPFQPEGQDWGLPPFVPQKLRAASYEPFVQTVRATLRHSGSLRIDHVMGLFRAWWVPAGMSGRDGAYVRYAARDLLQILALEAVRAGAFVVGEDLGTVEESARAELRRHGVLTYRLLCFEDAPPRDLPQQALAAVTTHDLPTLAGLWSGADEAELRRIGAPVEEMGHRQMRERLARAAGLPSAEPAGPPEGGPATTEIAAKQHAVEDAIRAVHEALADAPSHVVLATLEDALAVPDRPNVPGTTAAVRPNWSLALPVPLEEIERHPLARDVATKLASRPRRPAR